MLLTREFRNIKPTLAELAMLQGRWREHPIYQGCIGHWLMNEGITGPVTAMYDISGREHHMIPVGGVAWGVGNRGPIADLNGTDAALDAGNSSDFDFGANQPFFISLWMRIDALTTGRMVVDKAGGSGAAIQFRWTTGAGWFMRLNDGSTINDTPVNTSISLGVWYHILFGRDSVNQMIFVNGILDNSEAALLTSLINTANLSFGMASGGFLFVDGALDDIRVYRRSPDLSIAQTLYYEPYLPFMWAQEGVRTYFFMPPAGRSAAAMHYYTRLIG